jgi:putative transposase
VRPAIPDHRGADFGLNDWATFNNGETIANPRFTRNEMPRMADLQRQQARKKRGSVRYTRLGKQAAKLHERIGNPFGPIHDKTTSCNGGIGCAPLLPAM